MAVVFVFSLIHQALACALEHNDSPPGMRKDFSHGLLLCLSRLLSQWHWILGQNLFKWCFIREQENWKLKSCRAVSRSTWCTFTTSKYLHWPRSAWKPVSRFGNSLHPHPPPRLPPWAAWITLTSAHPSLRLYSLITCKQQDSKQEIILCSFLPFCNHLSSWVKLNP